jgi:hypothetical protein
MTPLNSACEECDPCEITPFTPVTPAARKRAFGRSEACESVKISREKSHFTPFLAGPLVGVAPCGVAEPQDSTVGLEFGFYP